MIDQSLSGLTAKGLLASLFGLLAPAGVAQFAFAPASIAPSGLAPTAIVAGDWNGDGFVDFAVADLAAVSVVVSTCSGTYASPTIYPLAPLLFSFVRGLAVGDLDGDGHADLVAVRAGGYPADDGVATVLRNLGDGSFAAAVDHPVFATTVPGSAMTPHDVVVADLDGDGRLDIAAAATQLNLPAQPGFFAIVRNLTGPGGPISLASAVNVPTSRQNASAIVAADLDNDGDVDLATSNRTSNSVTVLRNDGSGVAGSVRSTTLSGANAAPLRLALGDIDGDGYLDMLALNYFGNSYSVVQNLNGSGNPARAGEFADGGQFAVGSRATPSTQIASDIKLADCDGDGALDLVVGLIGDFGFPGAASILQGSGQASFGVETPVELGPHYTRLAIVDLDNDGDVDIAAASNASGAIGLLDNRRTARWDNLGHALAGTRGLPCLVGVDAPASGLQASLQLRNTVGPTVAILAVSLVRLDLPFGGGLIVPDPFGPTGSLWHLATTPQGTIDFDFDWPALPPGLVFYTQIWMGDPGGAYGLSSSNALLGRVP